MKLAYENIGIFLIILSFTTASLPPFSLRFMLFGHPLFPIHLFLFFIFFQHLMSTHIYMHK